MSTAHPEISILLPTYNNAAHLRPVLEAVKWAHEILVVDSFSTDDTLALCREYGARIVQHEYIQSAKQKNWAIPQCAAEWILQIDADEILEEGAHAEIEQAIQNAPEDLDGFQIPFKHHILGRWESAPDLYPGYHLRLFRKSVGRFEDKEVHARVIVPGRVGVLEHHILHHGMKSISNQLRNLDRYSRYQADELNKRGKKFHWYQLALRPPVIFAYYFIWKRGFTAGYRGLLIAALNTAFDFWSHAKLWELETFRLTASPK